MSDKEKAAAAKAKGNTDFQAKNFKEAIKHFTDAIGFDPTDHVFYSNRSACYASIEEYEKALEDGTKCVSIKPDWPKGYTRKGLAEFFLSKYDDSAETYKAGLKLAPEDAAMKEGLKKAMDAKYEVPGSGAPPRGRGGGGGGGAGGAGGGPGGAGGGMFGQMDPAALATAAARNPKIKEYMQDKELMQKFNLLAQLGGSNPQMQQQMLMQVMQTDPRLLELYMAMQGIDVSAADMEAMRAQEAAGGGGGSAPPSRPAPKETKKEEPPPDLRTDEQKEADVFKTKGNELYKKKQFEEAIAEYDKAIEKCPNDITYHNNKCAVWTEMGKTKPEYLDKVLEACNDIIQRRYEMNGALPGGGSFEKVAKIFCRIAVVYEQKKQYDEAIEYYNKALMEDNNRTSRNALRELEKKKEKFEKEAYLDPAKAEEHREKGNEFFKAQKWAEAKKEYDEAIKRNPNQAKTYSNRAASLQKLAAHPDALRDLDECLKLDPTFVKAYSRKGVSHFFMKEYHKALQAYEQGLKLDPTNEECKAGRETTIQKVQSANQGQVDEEQVRHAMADPEIQAMLKDPQINLFLKDMQENPRAAQDAMSKDPKLANAVEKLMAAGILRTG